MRYLTLIALPFLLAAVQVQRKPPVIIDTDVGTDDLMAISYLLAGGEVDIRAITVVNGLCHVEKGAKNVLGLLELAGGRAIPVYIGEARPLAGSAAFPEDWRRLSDDAPGMELPQSTRAPENKSAVEYLAHEMRLPPGGPSLRILALGPLTNIARALDASSARLRGIRSIVIMGGAVSVPGNLGDGGVFKTANRSAEWNMYIDPLAARRVFAAGLPIELIPLDATNRVPIDSAFIRTFSKKAATPLGRFVSHLLTSELALIDQNAFYAWDPLAAVVLAHPGVAGFTDYHLEIGMKPPVEGRTQAIPQRSPNARVAVDADAAAFVRLFGEAFFRKSAH